MRVTRTALAGLLALWFALAAAFAYDAAIVGQTERALEEFRTRVDQITRDLRNPALTEEQLTEYRNTLEGIRTKAIARSGQLTEPINEINQQIKSLGPAPTADQTEPAGVADQRAKLQDALNRLQSVKSQLDVLAVEIEQTAGRISTIQRDQFFQRIFESGHSILNPQLWVDAASGIGILASRVSRLLTGWWKDVSGTANPIGLGLIPLFIVLFAAIYRLASIWLGRWTEYTPTAERQPDDVGRLWRIFLGQVTTLATLFILFTPISLSLTLSGYMTPRFAVVQNTVFSLTGATFIYYMLAVRVLAPGKAPWRVVDLDDGAARRLVALTGLTAFLSIAHRRLIEISDTVFLPAQHSVAQSAILALAMFLLMGLVLLILRNQKGLAEPAGRRLYFGWASGFVPLVWLMIFIGLAALVFGYLALAAYLAQQLFRTAVLIVVLFLLHHMADTAVAASFDSQSGLGTFLRRVTGLGERAIDRIGLVFRVIVDLLLVVIGLPLLFLLWTVTWVDFRSLINTALLGIRIGQITISPWSVGLVLIILISGIILTNLVIRWLDRRVLVETRFDKGVQDSIRKGSSYAGYILAAGFALSAAGLDFSNIAIIAGALGVGIGFGLQSIANNFISGLILLAERPIRVGDWVATAAGEGMVKRINVRSTEIETFDNCSIIVPNSSLITDSVRNWTYDNTLARFSVAVTVAYDSDPEVVKQLLLESVRQHPKVLTNPAPVVVLIRFGQFGLDFEVRAYVANALDAFMTASDTRFDVLSRLREKGITIPSPFAVMQQS